MSFFDSVEPKASMRTAAAEIAQQVKAYTEAGFTRSEAISIILTIITAQIQHSNQTDSKEK